MTASYATELEANTQLAETLTKVLVEAMDTLPPDARAEAEGLLAMSPDELALAMTHIGLATHPLILGLLTKAIAPVATT